MSTLATTGFKAFCVIRQIIWGPGGLMWMMWWRIVGRKWITAIRGISVVLVIVPGSFIVILISVTMVTDGWASGCCLFETWRCREVSIVCILIWWVCLICPTRRVFLGKVTPSILIRIITTVTVEVRSVISKLICHCGWGRSIVTG